MRVLAAVLLLLAFAKPVAAAVVSHSLTYGPGTSRIVASVTYDDAWGPPRVDLSNFPFIRFQWSFNSIPVRQETFAVDVSIQAFNQDSKTVDIFFNAAPQIFRKTFDTPPQVVFSQPTETFTSTGTDLNSGAVFYSKTGHDIGDSSVSRRGGVLDSHVVSTVSFEPGHLLFSSPDSACASFDCMIPDTSDLFLGSYNVSFGGSSIPVPEPETYALMLAGLALIAGIARTRLN